MGAGDPNSSPQTYMTGTSQVKPSLLGFTLYDVYMETVLQQRRNLGLILNETSEWEVEICRQITKDRVRKTFRHPKVGSFSILSNVNETGDGLKTIQNLADFSTVQRLL